MPKTTVLKFGGSSVGTPDKICFVAKKIASVHKLGHQVLVVVSAMADTTDELISLSKKVTLHSYEREMDMLLTAGERISMALLSMALRDLSIDSISFTGSQSGIITDENHTRARIIEIKPIRVVEELKKGKVVIVAGFQGVSLTKEITTLGRGGSDTTAVAMAAELRNYFNDVYCEIYSDVSGIYSADPRKIPQAIRYEELSLNIVHEIASNGAQVLHPRAVEIARSKHFNIFTGDTMSGIGTKIEINEKVNYDYPKIIAVTSRSKLNRYEVEKSKANSIINSLAKERVPTYHLLIDTNGSLRFTLNPDESANFINLNLKETEFKTISTVSLIGYQLQTDTTVLRDALKIFSELKIDVLDLTCHSQSITFSVNDLVLDRAVKAMHKEFIETPRKNINV